MSENTQYPWLFKGAYATYYGIARMGRPPAEFEVNNKLEVEEIDLVNQRVKIRQTGTLTAKSLLGKKKLSDSNEADWIGIGEMKLISKTPYDVEGERDSQIGLESIGKRQCIIQQYAIKNSLSKGLVFWDKDSVWPILYVNIFRRISDTSTNLLDITKEVCDRIVTGSWGNLNTELKKSNNPLLREDSIVVPLKETNIPFIH